MTRVKRLLRLRWCTEATATLHQAEADSGWRTKAPPLIGLLHFQSVGFVPPVDKSIGLAIRGTPIQSTKALQPVG